jgi:hypothetical protein
LDACRFCASPDDYEVSAVVHDYGEEAMTSFTEMTRDALLQFERFLTDGKRGEQLPTADVLPTMERRLPNSERDSAGRDYSEEAIPERDPAYRLPSGTDNEEPTIEAVSAEVRRELARRLQQLGMSRARAAAVVSL